MTSNEKTWFEQVNISLPVVKAKTEGPLVGNRVYFYLEFKNLKIFSPL